MQYSELMMDHCENPRNIGSFDEKDNNVGMGMIGSPSCGDILKMYIKVGSDKKTIWDVRFKTFGCGGSVASGSLATEKIKGKTLDEALNLTNQQLIDELELPKQKAHCSVMAAEAISEAVRNYRKKNSL